MKSAREIENVQSKKDGRVNNGGARNGAGRKPFEPTEIDRQIVQRMLLAGIPKVKIAQCVGSNGGVSVKTLERHFPDELNGYQEHIISKITDGVVARALDGDNACAFFYLKTQGQKYGWRESSKHELTGPEGKPLFTHIERVIIDPKKRDK